MAGGRVVATQSSCSMPDPLRNFRAPESLWAQAKAVASMRGESLSDVLRAALERYVKRHG